MGYIYTVAQVDIIPLIGALMAVAAVVLNYVSVRQAKEQLRQESERYMASKEFVNQKIDVIDKQIVMIDKEICADRATNIREHDSMKEDFIRSLDELRKIVLQALNNKK